MDRDRIVFARHESIAPLRLPQFARALSGEQLPKERSGCDAIAHRCVSDPIYVCTAKPAIPSGLTGAELLLPLIQSQR
jgi:hypothetical protein